MTQNLNADVVVLAISSGTPVSNSGVPHQLNQGKKKNQKVQWVELQKVAAKKPRRIQWVELQKVATKNDILSKYIGLGETPDLPKRWGTRKGFPYCSWFLDALRLSRQTLSWMVLVIRYTMCIVKRRM